jgi:hypothetical protein
MNIFEVLSYEYFRSVAREGYGLIDGSPHRDCVGRLKWIAPC